MSKSPLSVIFAGTPEFAVPSLKALASDKSFRVDLVITQPDRPTGRKQMLTPPPVKICAESLGIRVWQPENINKEWPLRHSSGQASDQWAVPDFFVVVAYGQILKKEILEFPKIAAVNVHASLLPRWRGASPIHHAILAGDAETGVTVQHMAEALDTGAILSQETTRIGNRETFEELYARLSKTGAKLLLTTLKSPLSETAQDELLVTVCHKLTRQTGDCDPKTMTAEEIDRKVRALVPWPGTRLAFKGTELKLLATSLQPLSGALEIPCANGSMLYVTQLQEPGKSPMPAEDWKRGRK